MPSILTFAWPSSMTYFARFPKERMAHAPISKQPSLQQKVPAMNGGRKMKCLALIKAVTLLLILPGLLALAQSTDEKDLPYLKRATLAVRYVEKEKTPVNLIGTSLAPRILGKVEVEYKKNDARIKIKVENLDSPQTFGAFYTTF